MAYLNFLISIWFQYNTEPAIIEILDEIIQGGLKISVTVNLDLSAVLKTKPTETVGWMQL